VAEVSCNKWGTEAHSRAFRSGGAGRVMALKLFGLLLFFANIK